MSLGTAYGSAAPGFEIIQQRPSDTEKGLVTRPILPRSAFGDIKVENTVPVIQMTGVYGLTDKQEVFTSLSGTALVADGMFVCTSGTDTDSFGSISSRRQAKYRSGQGMLARFTALFDTPQIDSHQIAGLLNTTDQVGFGYLGTDFGIVYNHGGHSEVQEITLSAAATGSENATVTIDGTGYTVALTAGTVQHNAFEIANSLNSQVPLWDFSSNDDQVVVRGLRARVYSGAFTFSSGTAAGTFSQVGVGVAPIETIIKQADWNINVRENLDPSKGNVYQVQFQYLGFGAFFFSIENPETGEYEIVHIIEYSNANLIPNLGNPTFHVGWSATNEGNTTSLTVKGGSASMFNEGPIVPSEAPRTVSNIQLTVATGVLTNILTLRNRLVFNGKRNSIETAPFIVTVFTDSSKGALVQIVKNAVPSGDLNFTYVNKDQSTSEIATDAVVVTGGTPTVSFVASVLGTKVDLNELGLFLFQGESFTVSAQIISGSSASVTATVTSVEDQ